MSQLNQLLCEHCNLENETLGQRPGTTEYSNDCFFLEIEVFQDAIHILYLQTYLQGDGYGRAVTEALLRYGRNTNRIVIVLTPLDEARGFWTHMGFVEHPHNPDQMIPEGFAELLAA